MVKNIETEQFIKLAKELVATMFTKDDSLSIDTSKVYVVWYCKTIQNHKALLSGHPSGFPFYEVTYNGDKGEMYVDEYVKVNKRTYDVSEAGYNVKEIYHNPKVKI